MCLCNVGNDLSDIIAIYFNNNQNEINCDSLFSRRFLYYKRTQRTRDLYSFQKGPLTLSLSKIVKNCKGHKHAQWRGHLCPIPWQYNARSGWSDVLNQADPIFFLLKWHVCINWLEKNLSLLNVISVHDMAAAFFFLTKCIWRIVYF